MPDSNRFSYEHLQPIDFSQCWTFSLALNIRDDEDCDKNDPHRRPDNGDGYNNNDDEEEDRHVIPPEQVKQSFACHGFAVFPNVLNRLLVDALNDRLEDVLRGRYDRNNKPDKTPKLLKNEYPNKHAKKTATSSSSDSSRDNTSNETTSKTISYAQGPLGFSGNLQNVKVLQIINIHKADSLFRQLAVSPVLGQVVGELAGWTGTRLAQDQVWAKPPGAAPLTFHRDSPYFMFTPADVVTVWVALDDMDDDAIGPLQYIPGSHEWGDGRVGSSSQFFDARQGTDLLESAAAQAGACHALCVQSMVGLEAGGISIHNGRTWHGSGPNQSKHRARRGLGLHYVPASVRFTADAAKSRLWKSYLGDGSIPPEQIELPEEDFPIIWMREGQNQ